MNKLSSLSHIAKQGYRHFRGCFSMGADDIILASFPRSGSTWFRTVFANAINLKNGVNENTHMKDLESVMPVLGFSNLSKSGPSFYRPRLIKTHRLHREIKPFRPKQVLHLWRHSTGVMKSCFRYYSASRMTTIEDNISDYIRNPKFGLPAWREHFDNWQPQATVSLQYEMMRSDTAGEIARVLEELGYHELLPFVDQAVNLASIENMRKSEATAGVRDPDRFIGSFETVGVGATDKTTLSESDQSYIDSLSHDIAGK
jgi:hypothetical protein